MIEPNMVKDLTALMQQLEAQVGEVRVAFDDGVRPFMILPGEGGELRLHNMESYLSEPLDKAKNVTFHDLPSFAAYIALHKKSNTSIYADVDSLSLVAVFNDDEADQAHWRNHRATLQLQHSESYKAWSAMQTMKFEDFRRFVDRNAADIGVGSITLGNGTSLANPSVASLLSMLRQATVENKSESTVRNKGAIDEHELIVRNGLLIDPDFPEKIVLAMPIFRYGEDYAIVARVSVFESMDKPHVRVSIDRQEQQIFDAFNDVAVMLSESIGSEIPIYKGEL